MKTADALLMSDLHLRDDSPECRTDDFFAARDKKLAFINDLQRKHGCPIIDAGDMFHKWEVSSALEGYALKNLPHGIITIPGNHDLPNHNLKLYEKSSLHVLEAAKRVQVLLDGKYTPVEESWEQYAYGFPYGSEFKKGPGYGIAIVHVYVGESIPPNVEGYTPQQLLDALPGYDLIVSGHNHVPLSYAKGKRLVVNPGSVMRMFADQVNMQPRVYLWYAADNHVEEILLPIEKGVISREHIEHKKEQTARLDTFVERLKKDDVEMSLSFEKNIEAYFAKHRTRKAVRDLVQEALGG